MDIYNTLATKPHNSHYLRRYVAFIIACMTKTYDCYTEKHHICPQADDMFPEYKDLREHPWNNAVLTARQHFIAHILIWKAFPQVESQAFALYAMRYKNGQKLNSRIFAELKAHCITLISRNSKTWKHTSESKRKRSDKMRGKIWITDGISNRRITNGPVPLGFVLGRTINKSVKRVETSIKCGKATGERNRGMVSAYDLVNNVGVSIPREEFKTNQDRYCGITSKRIPK